MDMVVSGGPRINVMELRLLAIADRTSVSKLWWSAE